tara:strand:- start:42073 stop:43965 length:1893 start_codon:yes stop_codon:yes gene_type:complete
MKSDLFKIALDVVYDKEMNFDAKSRSPSKPGLIKVANRSLAYAERHRGNWFKPEYDLEEISVAQDTDGYLFRAIKKKANRFLVSGFEIVGLNETYVSYIKQRIAEIESATSKPFAIMLAETAYDLIRFSNCMWVKSRNFKASSGKRRFLTTGREVDPVAGYFILPFETLYFKTKNNGEIKKILQETPTGESKEFFPHDVIHFYDNKKPGFAMGTPELLPVLDDIALLRRLEENVEELVESNLFPLFHYTVGSDDFPERYGPDGKKETEVVRDAIDYMPAGGVYVSDHRHKIQAVGSEGRALRIDGYLEYFKKRVFAGLGVSSVDMGEGDTANRATANVLSKSAIQDVEALQEIIRIFVEHSVFNELLLEGGFEFDPFDPMKRVSIKFGAVDKEVKVKLENQAIQLFSNKLITLTEARKRIGEPPIEEGQMDDTYFELFEKPLAELKSSIFGGGESENQAMPENQFGKKSGPNFDEKLEKHYTESLNLVESKLLEGLGDTNLSTDELLSLKNRISNDFKTEYLKVHKHLTDRLDLLKETDIKKTSVFNNIKWRFDSLLHRYSCKAYNYGVIVSAKESGLNSDLENLIGLEEAITTGHEACMEILDSSINMFDVNLDSIPPLVNSLPRGKNE